MTEDLRKIRWMVDKDWGKLGAQVVDGKVFIHCRIYEWSPSKLKECKKIWPNFLDHFRKHDVKRIYSMIPKDGDPMVHKFQHKFGLSPALDDGRFVYYMKEL